MGTLTNRKIGEAWFLFCLLFAIFWGRRGVGGECAFVSGIVLA